VTSFLCDGGTRNELAKLGIWLVWGLFTGAVRKTVFPNIWNLGGLVSFFNQKLKTMFILGV
jgi:hypothetical protein